MNRYHNKRFFKRNNNIDTNNNNNNNNNSNNFNNTSVANKYYSNNYNNNNFVNTNSRANKFENNSSVKSGSNVKILESPTKTGKESNDKQEMVKSVVKSVEEIKHPLLNRWQLWYQRPSRDKMYNWQNNLIEVIDFDTIEDFWQVFLHVQLPCNLTPGSDYSVFKSGIKPMWEDVRNKSGGRWLVTINKTKDRAFDARVIEQMWSEVLMCLIGEAFGDDDGQHVCGAVINTRVKYDRIAVWTDDANDKPRNERIGQIIMKRTNNAHFYYETHNDSQAKTAFNANTNYNTV